MNQHTIRTPFFEIGPKSYLYGQDVVDLAIAADKASEKYGVDIIFTTPIISISAVKAATKHIHVFAPHMDPLESLPAPFDKPLFKGKFKPRIWSPLNMVLWTCS